MKKIVFSWVFLFVFVATCLAVDLTGNWKGIIKVPDGDIELTCKLKADGNLLTGSIMSPYGEIPITDGKIAGDNFSFKVEIGENVVEQFGKVYGDSIIVKGVFRGTDIEHTFRRVN